MAERRYYRVAEQMFSIMAEDDFFAMMDNYIPFGMHDINAGTSHVNIPPQSQEPLFDLTIEKLSTFQFSPFNFHLLFTDMSDDDMPRIEIYRSNTERNSAGADCNSHSWLFRISERKASPICASISATADFRQASLQMLNGCDYRFAIDTAAMLLFAFTSAGHDILLLHASAMVRDNQAFLFLGRSGTGKSTHSRQWQQAYPDAWLLNDDNPVLRIMPDMTKENIDYKILIYGSPWSGKTPCYLQEYAPIKGIALLRQASRNKIYPLNLPEACIAILSSCSGLKIDPSQADAIHNIISQIVKAVTVYGLDCLPNTDAARLCHDTLKK